MATIVFHADRGNAELCVERAVFVQITGRGLSAGGPILARHQDGAWHIGSQRLERITFQGLVGLGIELNGNGRDLGFFSELCLIGDLVVSFDGPVARYDTTLGRWLESTAAPLPLAA